MRNNLGRVFSDRSLQEAAITKKLAEIDPRLRWEVGPYDPERSFFAFSPNLNLDLLPLTEALTRVAPELPAWMFLSSKPRKRWKSQVIEITDANDRIVRYDINKWRYYLTSFNGGEFFDVNLIPYGCEGMPLDDLRHVASLFVEFELEERMFVEFIDRTNIILPSELKEFADKAENLHDQIQQQLAKRVRH